MKRTETARRQKCGSASSLVVGESLLERCQFEAAAQVARRILKGDPSHLGGLELLARAYWRAGNFEASLDALRHLIRLNPYEPGYHYLRAMALQSLGHYGEAIQAFGRCLADAPENLTASAAASIQDLEQWQESVIAELLKSDTRFRSEYKADPLAACRARGFAFTAESPMSAAQLRSVQRAVVAWDRPS